MIYHNSELVPNVPGVYAIRNIVGQIKWIGQSVNMGQRLRSHKYFRRRNLDSVLAWPIDSKEERCALEKEMIETFRPLHNRVYNIAIRSVDVNRPTIIWFTEKLP